MNASLKAFQVLLKLYIGKVNYIDHNQDAIPNGNLLSPATYKRKSFEYEHELRALIAEHNDSENIPLGKGVKIDISTLIGEVYTSPLAGEWYKNLVERILERYSLQRLIKTSSISARPYF